LLTEVLHQQILTAIGTLSARNPRFFSDLLSTDYCLPSTAFFVFFTPSVSFHYIPARKFPSKNTRSVHSDMHRVRKNALDNAFYLHVFSEPQTRPNLSAISGSSKSIIKGWQVQPIRHGLSSLCCVGEETSDVGGVCKDAGDTGFRVVKETSFIKPSKESVKRRGIGNRYHRVRNDSIARRSADRSSRS
jgi:hypothetical protein